MEGARRHAGILCESRRRPRAVRRCVHLPPGVGQLRGEAGAAAGGGRDPGYQQHSCGRHASAECCHAAQVCAATGARC